VFRKLTSFQACLVITIALGAAGLHSVPSFFQVASSTTDRCNDAGGPINENETCVLPPASTEPQCPYKDWIYVPEMKRCAPGPPTGNPASGDSADNATQDRE
jgi:hypothetical protein